MTILNEDATVVSAAMTDAFGASAPTTQAGLEKEADQTGIFIFSKTDYDLYLKNAAGAWVEYGSISGARESITVPWGSNTAAFFKCADAGAKMHVHRKTGDILYDTTPENDGDDQNTLLTSAGTAAQEAQNYTFPAADGNANQVLTTDGAGTVTWADGAAGSCAASNFTFDSHILPDTNAVYDLGSAEKKVRHLFLSDNSIKFESGDLGVADGKLTFNGESVGEGGTMVLKAALADGVNFTWSGDGDANKIAFARVLTSNFSGTPMDTTTYEFTVPADGYYDINVNIALNNIQDNVTQYQSIIGSNVASAETWHPQASPHPLEGINVLAMTQFDPPSSQSIKRLDVNTTAHLTAGTKISFYIRQMGGTFVSHLMSVPMQTNLIIKKL